MAQKSMIAAAFALACVTSAFAQQPNPPQTQTPPQTPPPTQGEGQRQGQAPATKGTTSQTGSQSGSLAQADRNFITQVAASGHEEVELAQLAQQKGSSPTVKALAERLQKDHSQANQELSTLAQQKGVTLPATHERKPASAKLDKLDGAAFDRAYSNLMVQNHTNSIALFERESKSKDADLRAFAEKTLPTLREHLRMAKEAQSGTTSTSGTKPSGMKPSGNQPSGTPPSGTQPSGAKPTSPSEPQQK